LQAAAATANDIVASAVRFNTDPLASEGVAVSSLLLRVVVECSSQQP
jgi:hypothetical protein